LLTKAASPCSSGSTPMDLTHWIELQTKTAVNFTVEFNDLVSGAFGHRFYRARQLNQ
jgi:hypothetical protein